MGLLEDRTRLRRGVPVELRNCHTGRSRPHGDGHAGPDLGPLATFGVLADNLPFVSEGAILFVHLDLEAGILQRLFGCGAFRADDAWHARHARTDDGDRDLRFLLGLSGRGILVRYGAHGFLAVHAVRYLYVEVVPE